MRLEHLGMEGSFQIERLLDEGRLVFRMDNSCGSTKEDELSTQEARRLNKEHNKAPRRLLGLIALEDPHCAWMQGTKLLICHILWTRNQ